MTARGTSRRYRARQEALTGLHGALEGPLKWVPSRGMPEQALSTARTQPAVVIRVEVETDQVTSFKAFTDEQIYSRWLGVPVTIADARFAATMEWGTEVRGSYDVVCPQSSLRCGGTSRITTYPCRGGLIGYLRVRPAPGGGSSVEVHQLAETPQQAAFMETAWGGVLGRFRSHVLDAISASARTPRRARRETRHSA